MTIIQLKIFHTFYLKKLNLLLNDIETIWIEGNHDYNLKNKKKLNGNFLNYYCIKNYEFVHIKSEVNELNNLQFSGHYHPKTTFKINGVNFQFKCFVLTKNFVFFLHLELIQVGSILIPKRLVKFYH